MDRRLVSFATVIRVVKQRLTATTENGRPNRRNEAEFSNFSGVLWMGHERMLICLPTRFFPLCRKQKQTWDLVVLVPNFTAKILISVKNLASLLQEIVKLVIFVSIMTLLPIAIIILTFYGWPV